MPHILPRLCMLVFVAGMVPAQVVFNPANGHYYEFVRRETSWFEADTMAHARRYAGFSGYLATATARAESTFIASLLGTANAASAWLGGLQLQGGVEPAGSWNWLTGEPMVFTDWYPGQPDNDAGADGIAVESNSGYRWTDRPRASTAAGFVVEYAATPAADMSLTRVRNAAQVSEVHMTTSDLRLVFNTAYGGTPLRAELRDATGAFGRSVIWEHAGAGLNVVYETGQDATQSSPDGITTFPIARFDDPVGTDRFNYYARETTFTPPTAANQRAVYEVTGSAPFFWLSHEWNDDAIAGLANPRVGDWDRGLTGWFTGYTTTCAFNCAGRSFYSYGTPIWFEPVPGGQGSGILFVGNEISGRDNPSQHWSTRLCSIPEGRFACRVRVSMAQSSTTAIAGIFFRRHVPANATVNQAFSSDGYALFVNRSGVLQVQRNQGGVGQTVWNTAAAVLAPAVGTATGTVLELRTHNGLPGQVQILVDDRLVGTYTDPAPILGEHLGLFAQTDPRTNVRFSERQVCDMGLEFVSRYTAQPGGQVEIDVRVRKARFAEAARHPIYSHGGMPEAFFDKATTPTLDTIAVLGRSSQFTSEFITGYGGANPGQGSGLLLAPVLGQSRTTFSGWGGQALSQPLLARQGLFLTPLLAEVDGVPAAAPHLFLQVATQAPIGPLLKLAVSPLPFGAAAPYTIFSHRMVSLLSRREPTHLAARGTRFGVGCQSASGLVPQHEAGATAPPRIGGTLMLELTRARARTAAMLVLGVSETSLPLAGAGAPGCSLFASPEVVVPMVTSSSGTNSVAVSIAYDRAMVGAVVHSQFLVMEAAGAVRTFVVSNPARALVGF